MHIHTFPRRLQAATALVVGLSLTAMTGTSQAADVTFKINPAKSKFVVTASTSGLIVHDRPMANKAISGTVGFSKTMQPQSVMMTAKANAFHYSKSDESATDVKRIDDATRDKILEASKYPNITFKSTKITPASPIKGAFSVKISGQLTMHGVTKSVVIPASGSVSGNTLRARGSLTVDQSAYGITLLKVMGGVIKVNDPVTLAFDIVATR